MALTEQKTSSSVWTLIEAPKPTVDQEIGEQWLQQGLIGSLDEVIIWENLPADVRARIDEIVSRWTSEEQPVHAWSLAKLPR